MSEEIKGTEESVKAQVLSLVPNALVDLEDSNITDTIIVDDPTLKVFNFAEYNIETIIKDGEPWFIAKDICKALDLKNVSGSCSRLDPREKSGIRLTDGEGKINTILVINEAGLYSLIFTSKKPEAKEFKYWVTSEVLPSIRKTGKYAIGQANTNQDLTIFVKTLETLTTVVSGIGNQLEFITTSFNNRFEYLEKTNQKLLDIVERSYHDNKEQQSIIQHTERKYAEKENQLNEQINTIITSGYSSIYEYLKGLGKTQSQLKKGYSLQTIGRDIENYMLSQGQKIKYNRTTRIFPIYLIDLYFQAKVILN